MEVALVFVLAGLVAVSLVKDFTIWRQRKTEGIKLSGMDEGMANWFRILSHEMQSLEDRIVGIRKELQLHEASRIGRAEMNRNLFILELTSFTDTLMAKLTMALKNDVDSLKAMIARSAKTDKDSLFEKAVSLAYAKKHVNASLLRKGLNIGWKRSNALLERLLEENVVIQNGKPGNYLPLIQGENKP